VQPAELPVGLQINYGNGGGAAHPEGKDSAPMPPAQAHAATPADPHPRLTLPPPRRESEERPPPYLHPEDDDDDDDTNLAQRSGADARLVADKLAAKLDKNGAGEVKLTALPPIQRPSELVLQATYADPNGEIQSLTRTLPVWPAAVVLGVRADRWTSARQQ